MTARSRPSLAVSLLALVLAVSAPGGATAQARPEGEMRWALYVTLSPGVVRSGRGGG